VALGGMLAAGAGDPSSLTQPLYPLSLPAVPLSALVGILVAALPSVIAPTPVGARTRLQEAVT
jgi:hypothetical protein